MRKYFSFLLVLFVGCTISGCEHQEELSNEDLNSVEVIEEEDESDIPEYSEELDTDNEEETDNELVLCDDGEYAEVCVALFYDKTYGYNFLSSQDGYDVYEYVGERELPTNDHYNIIYVGNNRVYFSHMPLETYIGKVYLVSENFYLLSELAEIKEDVFLEELVALKYFRVKVIMAPNLKEGEYRCYDIGKLNDVCVFYEDLHN